MTAREYRRLSRNFDRQARCDLPYSPSRVGLAPRIAAAWREYWRPDPKMGLASEIDPQTYLLSLFVCGLTCLAIIGGGVCGL